jgi:adenylate cyclase
MMSALFGRQSSDRPFGLRILGQPDESPRTTRIRVQLMLISLIVGGNVFGAAWAYLFGLFVIPGPTLHDPTRIALLNLLGIVLYSGGAVAIAVKWGTHLVTVHARWLRDGLTPSRHEQRIVLQIPIFVAGLQLALWLPAAGLGAAFNAALADHLAVQVALAATIAGLVTAGNAYVVGELMTRPLAARALAAGDPPTRLQVPGVRARAILAWLLGSAVPVAGLMMVAAAALVRPGVTTTRLAITVLALGGAMLAFGLRVVALAARAVSDPIKGLRDAVDRVEKGDFNVAVPIYDGTEIGLLQAGFNRMAAGLAERERIRAVFERHVGEEVVRSALAGGDDLGGTSCQVGVLFVDIIGSTRMATRRSPDEVVALLNGFFAVVVDVVAVHGGMVNKFEGDGALVVFGAPAQLPNPARAALAASRQLGSRLAAENPDFEVGIGISAGRVVAGNIGALARYEYTVIGDPVNEAARLTDLAKGLPGHIAASEAAVRQAGTDEARCWVLGDEVTLRGRQVPTRIAVPTGPAATVAGQPGGQPAPVVSPRR